MNKNYIFGDVGGCRQYICDTKHIIYLSGENPSKLYAFLKNWTP